MNSQTPCAAKTTCSLCDREFVPDATQPQRCPYCLRSTGVSVGTLEALTAGEATTRIRPKNTRFSMWLWGGAVASLTLAIMGAVWWFVRESKPNPGHRIEEAFREAGLPLPWSDVPRPLLEEPLPRNPEALREWLDQHDLLKTTNGKNGEEREGAGSRTGPLEALARIQFALWNQPGPWLPCGKRPSSLTDSINPLDFGLCLQKNGVITEVVPLHPGTSVDDAGQWEGYSPEETLALFAASQGEAHTDPKEIYAWFHLALALDDSPYLRFRLGMNKLRLGLPDFAVEDFRVALARHPDGPGFRLMGRLLLEQLQRPEDAMAAFRTALEQEPENHETRVGIAMAWLILGEGARALEALEEVQDQAPETPGVNLGLARYWFQQGDQQQGLAALHREVQNHPAPSLLLWLAEMELRSGNEDQALEVLQRGVEVLPEPAGVGAALVSLLVGMNRDEEASHWRQKITTRLSDDQQQLFHQLMEAMAPGDPGREEEKEGESAF